MPVPNRINPDIEKERKNASFDVNEFASWYHGGKDKLEMKRKLGKYIKCDNDF